MGVETYFSFWITDAKSWPKGVGAGAHGGKECQWKSIQGHPAIEKHDEKAWGKICIEKNIRGDLHYKTSLWLFSKDTSGWRSTWWSIELFRQCVVHIQAVESKYANRDKSWQLKLNELKEANAKLQVFQKNSSFYARTSPFIWCTNFHC